jgi:hypothetical protein
LIVNIKNINKTVYLSKEQMVPMVMKKSMYEFHYELFAGAIMHDNKVIRCVLQQIKNVLLYIIEISELLTT